VLRATIKSLLARKLRLALTALAVVLGVGFMAGTFVLTDTMSKAFDELFATTTAGTDVVVRSKAAFDPVQAGPGGGGSEGREAIPEELVSVVQAVDGVGEARGGVQGYAQIVDPATGDVIGGFGPPTIGASWDPSVLTLRSGSAPEGGDEVAIDAATASDHDIQVGDGVRILFQGPPGEFTVVGIAGFGTADNLAGATLAVFDLETAQTVLDKEGVLDAISVTGEEGVAATELRARIAAVLPNGVEAVTGSTVADEGAEALNEGLGFFRIALLIFAFIALFVGAFIIFNTFSIITAQRTRELALLRALGATGRQVMTSVLTEAAITGLFASIVGVLAGLLIAIGLQGLLSAFGIDLPSTSTQLLPRTIIASLVVGTVVTVISSILPARRAARVAPIEALREAQETMGGASLRGRLISGLVIAGIGVAGLLYGLFGATSSAAQLTGFGAALTFVGVAVLSPLAARPIAGTIGAPLRRLGVAGKLGRENAMRNPRRTAATAAALMIGLGLVSLVTILASSLKASFDAALRDTLKADLTLSTSSFTAFSPEVAGVVRELPEVGAVAEFRQNGFRVDGTTAFLTAVNPETIEQVATLEMEQGDVGSLANGALLVHRDIALENDWTVGDTVELRFPSTGSEEFPLGGIYGENRLVGDWVVSLETYEENYTEQLDAFVLVKAATGVPIAAVKRAVEDAVAEFPNVQVQDQAAFREQQAGFIDQLLGLVTALLALAVMIALFGIVNTLGLSIFERRRELGLLRAVGMTRRQVRSMIRWESVIIALLGAVLGITIGVLFGWALQQALASEGVTELAIPSAQLAIYLAFAAVAGVLAAVGPARRAAKLNVLEAISYE
jgi:putative ABC transport system permease protein